ncbi:MAG: radical SAM protein [Leptospiraceae bacterium]|nr:radical SAM protein [Leptospiraceae bacterium]
MDPLADFRLSVAVDTNKPGIHFEAGPTLPPAAAEYLAAYLQKTQKYRSMGPAGKIRFSLYQPVLNSPAGHRSLYMRLRRKFARERRPQAATIGVTAACQCKCEHCSADYHMASCKRPLSSEQLQAAVREAVALGATTIILLGGEPLLNKQLESIIAAVDSRLAQTVLFTNGEFLGKQRCETLVRAGLDGIFVSIDSPQPSEHDALRHRPGLFDKLLAGVSNAKEAGLTVAISSYLTTERVRNGVFEKMMELGRRTGVAEVTFFDAIAVGRLKTGADQCSFLDSNSRRKIARLTQRYRSNPLYPAVTPQSVLTASTGSSFCFAANTQFYLSSTGDMCPCDFTPLSAGSYPDQSISVLWEKMINSPQYKRRSKICRMQDARFRSATIDRIPAHASLPYPLALLNAAK